VVPLQEPRGCQTGDSCSDNSNAHQPLPTVKPERVSG
jgi:hypothetical protein